MNKSLLREFWLGKISLWKAYWLIGELLNGLVLLIIFYVEIYFFNSDNSITQIPFLNFSNFSLISKCLVFSWTIFISVGIWKSAENYTGNFIWIIITFIVISYRCYYLSLIFFI